MSTPRQPGCPESMGILYLCGTHQKRLTSRYSVADLCVCAPSTIACAGAPNQHDQDTPGLGGVRPRRSTLSGTRAAECRPRIGPPASCGMEAACVPPDAGVAPRLATPASASCEPRPHLVSQHQQQKSGER
ncbi:hypothetical protein JB92DRAFT_2969479 [Gautieria morchelliformis]|nr:hypothetical protein JB92DRAFT_2969479 [Gautieria morchelliformis]